MDRRTLLAALPAAAALVRARPGVAAEPMRQGFSPQRLARIRTFLEKGVADRKMAGAVWRIDRRGELADQGAVGLADIESGRPMTPDAIFRIFSMTKPVTVTTALTYYEEGVFDLHDPISKWLPEFAQPVVQTDSVDTDGRRRISLAPARRAITVLDLMRHTSGVSYAGPSDAQGHSLFAQLGVTTASFDTPLSEWVSRIAKAPLVCEPGTAFNYGFGLDILGRLIEIWSGLSLDKAMQSRVLAPLGMSDTNFWAPPEKQARRATLYSPSSAGALLPDESHDVGGPVVRCPLAPYQNIGKAEPALKYGGAGLVSTIGDYARFLDMLRGGGQTGAAFGKVRILAPATVALISTDQLGERPAKLSEIWAGYGFGLGVEVDRGPAGASTPLPMGAFDWGGAASTWMWIDPKNDLTAQLWMQVLPSAPRWGQLFKQIVYGALVET